MKEDRSREQEKLRPVRPRGKKLVFLALGLIQVRQNWRLNDFAGYSFFFHSSRAQSFSENHTYVTLQRGLSTLFTSKLRFHPLFNLELARALVRCVGQGACSNPFSRSPVPKVAT